MMIPYALRRGLGLCATTLPLLFSLAGAGHGGNGGAHISNTPPTNPPDATVFLSCGAGEQPPLPDPHQTVCESLHQALSVNFPTQTFLLISPSDRPGHNCDHALWITLHITRADSHIIDAHLEWSEAGSAIVAGPTVTLSVLDRPLTPTLFPSLAKSLIKNSALPL